MHAHTHRSPASQRTRQGLAYGAAILTTLLVFMARRELAPLFEERPMMILFILPICLSAFLGGAGPGLLATIFSCALVSYFLIPPGESFAVEKNLDALQLFILFLNGVLISALSERLHRTQRRARSLPQLEAQVAHIADHVPGVLYTFRLHPDGRANFAYISPALEHLFDLQGRDLLDDAGPLFARIPEPDRSELMQGIQDSAARLQPWHMKFRYHHATRGELWIEGRSTPRRLPEGVTEWNGFAADITQSRKIERAWQESEQRLRDMMNAARAIVWIKDLQGRFLTVNKFMCDLLGRSENELIGRTVDELFPEQEAHLYTGNDRQVVVSGQPAEFQETVQLPDGEHIFLSAKFPLRDAEGKIYALAAMCSDVTELRLIEAQLRHQENLLREAGELVHLGGWEFDPDTGDGFWTEECARIHEAENTIRVKASEGLNYYQGEHRRRIEHAVQEAIHKGQPYDLELEMVTARGQHKWVRTIGHPVVENGKVTRLRGSIQDISQRKRVEQALLESEARFRSYVENAPAAVLVVDQTGTYVDCNPAAITMLGYERSELFTRSIATLVTEEDRPAARAHFQHVLQGGQAPGEFRVRRKNGDIRWITVHASRISDDRFMAYCVDVTERKQTEALIRQQSTALEAAANAIVITDRTGAIEWVNPAFCATSGYTATEALGRNPRDLIKSGRQDDEYYRQLWNTIASGQVWRGEIINRNKDGREYAEEMTITPIRDEGGEITHYVAIKQDITERKSLEAQLLRTQRLESVGRLASGIAHDLNNILAPVLLAPTILREAISDPSVLSIVDSVESSAQRGADIVRQLLTFGRGMEAHRAPLSLRQLIAGMVKIMNETFPRNITVRQDLPAQIMLVDGDETQLHQLLMNLCVNARDAMPDGGTISLGITEKDVEESTARIYAWVEPGPHVVLSVSDTGTGIPPELLDKIFDPFFTTKAPGEGTGLGLSTAIGIARNHRGFIDVQSTVGRGTTFLVHLPRSKSVTARPPDTRNEPLRKGRGQHVLLVDDEKSVRHVLGQILRSNGYHPHFASNGAEALALLEAGTFPMEVVITDLMMPVMDGWALITNLRKRPERLRIIIISGHLPQPDWMEKALRLSDGLLVKPCPASDLLQVLHETLAKPAGQFSPHAPPPQQPPE